MKKIGVLALICALLGMTGTALADTVGQLAEQAKTPWRETVTAHGRELTFEVTPRIPDVESMGLYRVSVASGEERDALPEPEYPPKRRGIAQRRKPEEVYPAKELDPDVRAFGNPLPAAEAAALAEEWFAPRLAQLTGVEVTLESVTCYSPAYLFDKNAQQWLDTAIEGDFGTYGMTYSYAFMGAPLLDGSPFYVDYDAYYSENAYMDRVPLWCVFADVDKRDQTGFGYALPRAEETIAKSVELAPLETVLGTLRGLAEEGYLRDVESLTLGYHAFCVGERPEEDAPGDGTASYLLMPVWEARGEVYADPAMEATEYYGEVWKGKETIVIDARTGEWITRVRVAGWE